MTNKLPTIQVNTSEAVQHWQLLQRQCKAFLESGYLPSHIKTLAQALVICWKGHELGIPPLQAFSSISIVKGKPCLSSELMLALIYSRLPGAKVTFTKSTNLECSVTMQRPHGEPQTFGFTMEDAKRAGIVVSDGAWAKYPAAMLRARAISAGARAVFPDSIMGCFTPEEMGSDIIELEPEDAVTMKAAPVNEDAEPEMEEEPKSFEGFDTIAKRALGKQKEQ